MSETADTIAIRIVSETETAQRNILAYGAHVQRTMTGVEVAVARAAETGEAAAKRQHAAYRDLGTALVKVSADAIDGKNAFQILGEQGTTVAASMVGLGGSIGRVAGFLSGPWGAILTTAVSVIGMLATKSGEAGSEQDKAAEAVDRLRAATDAMNAVTAGGFSNTEHSIKLKQKEIELSHKAAKAARDEAQDELRRLRVKVAYIKAVAPLSGSFFAKFYDGDIAKAEEKLAELETAIGDSGQAHRNGGFQIARDRALAALDPLEKARQVRDDSLQQVEAAWNAGAIGTQQLLDAQVAAIEADFARRVARLTRPAPIETPPAAPAGAPAKAAGPKLTPADQRLANYADVTPINVAGLVIPTEAEAKAQLWEAVAGLADFDVTRFEMVDPEQLEAIGKISAALKDDLAKGLADAIVAGKSLGDVLVDSFARAGAALIQSQITRLLDPGGDGSTGFIKSATQAFGALVGARKPPRRASGGHVSAGQLYRVNEGGIEGFRPAGSGRIVPLGQMAAARPTAGVTIVQPMNVSFAGAITTPELMAQFKAYADGVGQAAVIGGAAMAQARMAKRAARTL
ncbi:MAG: hypothetical protein Q7J32_11710 [Sphingomonadaceae bacterium]|nr:hypothetical protein [Sphingomonadaceae bacterium]